MIQAPSPQEMQKRAVRPMLRLPRFVPPSDKNLSVTDKFVVKTDCVWMFTQGAVVAGNEFPPGTDLDNMCLNGHLRPAMPHEENEVFVDVTESLRPGVPLMTQLNDANDAVARLKAEVDQLNAKNHELAQKKSGDYDPTKDQQKIDSDERYVQRIKELEKVIKDQDTVMSSMREKINKKGN